MAYEYRDDPSQKVPQMSQTGPYFIPDTPSPGPNNQGYASPQSTSPPGYVVAGQGQVSSAQYQQGRVVTQQQSYFPPQQALIPQQSVGPQQVVVQHQVSLNVVPIGTLSAGTAPVMCPRCHQRVMTRVMSVAGNTTAVWAGFLCLLACLGPLAYIAEGTKDVTHHCSNCGAHLATWYRSGRTEQKCFA